MTKEFTQRKAQNFTIQSFPIPCTDFPLNFFFQTTVFFLFVAHAPLFFELKILGIVTLVPFYVCL